MRVPSYQELMLPILTLSADGCETVAEYLPHIQKRFSLSTEEMEELLPSGKQAAIANRAHWARHYMYQAGLLEQVKRGHYRATLEGRQLLAKQPATLNNSDLMAFESFRAFKQRGRKAELKPATSATMLTDETPEALIEAAFEEIDTALQDEILAASLALSPARFEQLIVDLLVAMGYGSGEHSVAARIGKSGDGGVDGLINEDALGLDAVYVQAKRYDPANKVGRPALQAFVGSLTGEGASKGVFVTTSDFSKDAVEYVAKVQHRIVLLNGASLTRLMIKHGVGVRPKRTILLQSIDRDYFDEE